MSAGHLPSRFRSLFALRLLLLGVALGTNLLLLANWIEFDLSLIIFAAATSLYALVTAVWWRCPTCSKYPGNSVMPDLCESCGTELFGHDRNVVAATSEPIAHPERRIAGLLVMRFVYGAVVVAIFGWWGPLLEPEPIVFWTVSVLLMGVGVWGEWRWWRCPHCGGYLKRTFWPGRTCSKCGGRLL